jgi:hypothetical protein
MPLLLAKQADDMLAADEWDRIRAMCGHLAAFLADPGIARLDAVGAARRPVVEPRALQ